MDQMQGLIFSPAICGKMLTRHKNRRETSSNIQHIGLQQRAFVGQLRSPTYKYWDSVIFVKN